MVGLWAKKHDINTNRSTLAVKNEQLRSLLDEESEKLARQNTEYEQLRSSAVSLTSSHEPISLTADPTAPVRNGTKAERAHEARPR